MARLLGVAMHEREARRKMCQGAIVFGIVYWSTDSKRVVSVFCAGLCVCRGHVLQFQDAA